MVPAGPDYDKAPFTVIWEVTRACALRCVHCRADAQPGRDPRELGTEEAYALLRQVRDLGSPVFVLTGGDPLERPDLFEILEYARELDLALAVTPSGTPRLDRAAVERMRDTGVRRLALSLDGPTAEIHDGFRRQSGSFAWTLAALSNANDLGLATQVNTTVTRRNLHLLDEMSGLVTDAGVAMWSAFFLVTVGRASAADQLTAEEFERVFALLADTSERVPFGVRTAAAPHYRRFLLERKVERKRRGAPPVDTGAAGEALDLPRAPRGVTDGSGLVFVSHSGDVQPSGFLPLVAGNVRDGDLGAIYRESPLFRRLRDPAQLGGKCGLCEYRRVCAGSRARAWAVHGDPMAEEPACSYVPPKAAEA